MAHPMILIVEDDRDLVEAVARALKREGYDVLVARDGQDGLAQARFESPDLIVLDLILPIMDGLAVCRELRADSRTRSIPIVMATVRAGELDQVEGFTAGADDYVTKPYSLKVLIARIANQIRRSRGVAAEVAEIKVWGVAVDRQRHQALFEGRELPLTPVEFRLLEALVRQPGRAFTRQELMDAAIGADAAVTDRTIDAHIKGLRRKLGAAGTLIETVR